MSSVTPPPNYDESFEAMLESSLDWWGLQGVDISKLITAKTAKPSAQAKVKPNTVRPKATSPSPTIEPKKDDAERVTIATKAAKDAKNLQSLKTAISSFDAGVLSDSATQIVFARGNEKAHLMIIGESPGIDEDAAGQPFIGKAGQLLDKMLATIGIDETSAYITNACYWRAPGGRKPNKSELAFCKPFITRHIELIKPDYIILLGASALNLICDLNGITKHRGDWQNVTIGERDIKAIAMFHPAYLIKKPELKKETWRDLLELHSQIKSD